MDTQKVVLYVQPLSSAAYVLDKIKQSNLKCIAIFINYDDHFSIKTTSGMDYDDVIIVPEDPNVIVQVVSQQVGKEQVLFVLPGTDEILPYVEKLEQFYCPQFSNPVIANTLRTHKDQLNKYLLKKGISVAEQVVVDEQNLSSLSDLVASFEYPVFVKPNNGHAASFAVKKINCFSELQQHLSQSLGKKNVLTKKRIRSFLLEEFLVGTEYVVDTVSYEGKHYVTGLFRYEKVYIDNEPTYLNVSAEQIDSSVAEAIIAYTDDILSASQVRFGANHTEVMYTNDGPRLIEINPRISGGFAGLQKQSAWSYGMSQIELLIQIAKTKSTDMPKQAYRPSYTSFFYDQPGEEKCHVDLTDLKSEKIEVLYSQQQPCKSSSIQVVNTSIITFIAGSGPNIEYDIKLLREREFENKLFVERRI